MAARRPTNPRNRDLAAIHMAAQKLGMDRETYEAMLFNTCGVRSSKALDGLGRAKVLAALTALGAPSNPRTRGKPHNYASGGMPEMITKIEAQLADMKLPWSYADSIAQRMFGIAKIAWVRKPKELRAIIAALDVEQYKQSATVAIDELVRELHITEREFAELTANLPKSWRRNKRFLSRVLDYLNARKIKLHELEGTE
jgi:phage gp16-like protein